MTTLVAPLLSVHVVASGIDERMSVPLDRTLALGRDADCDVALPSATVSRRHLSLFMREGRLVVRDHSSNGTRVNGETLHLALRELAGPSALEVGPYSIAVRLESDVEPERPALPSMALSPGDETPQEDALGPLGPLMLDPEVAEIMLVDGSTLFVERTGSRERSSVQFADARAVRSAVAQLVSPLELEPACPIVDVRLQDGARVHAIFPPLVQRGACLTIRKPARTRWTLATLCQRGAFSSEMASFFEGAVRRRVNLLIVGAVGAGKTSLLDALSACIPERERIVTVEEVAELRCLQAHVISLVARPPELASSSPIGERELLRNALCMRADRIVLGDCRGAEAGELLRAMSSGQAGCMSTLQAHGPLDALRHFQRLCATVDVGAPRSALVEQIAESLGLVVHVARFADGTRRVASISELLSPQPHAGFALRDLFRFVHSELGEDGRCEGTFVALRASARADGSPESRS